MSCCTIKPKKNSSIKEFDKLKGYFDLVELEDLEKYRLLTLKDKAKRSNYDWIVWLQVKVPYGNTKGRSSRTNEEYLTGVCKNISDWVDTLVNFEKLDSGKQLSLFDDGTDDELEKEPPYPTSDGGWSKYHKDLEKIRKNNLMKKYSFFELCDLTHAWYTYYDIDRKHLLPQSDKEMIELVKEAIVKGTSTDEGHGRFDDTNYMTRDGALSDIELITRVKMLIRLHLVPYTREFHVCTDNSYSSWESEKQTSYRYWFDGKKINGSSWEDTNDFRSYELYDLEFIDWLRNHFNIAHKEVISDEDILKENLNCLFRRVYGFDNPSFDAVNEIKKAKNFKEFKVKALAFASLGNGGGSGYSIDGFDGSYNLFNGRKGKVLTIEQNIDQRISLNRSVEGLEISDFKDNSVYVYKLNFDEALEKAFEIFKNEVARQSSIFDFLAA